MKSIVRVSNQVLIKQSRGDGATQAVIVFPGIPGVKTKRNEDMAAHLTETLGWDSFVVHYPGLGENQIVPFRFRTTLPAAADAVSYVSSLRYEKIHFVGHSWGGLMTLMNLSKTPSSKLGKAVLLSPVTMLPDGNGVTKIINYFYTEYPEVFNPLPKDELVSEIVEIAKSLKYSIPDKNKLFVLQAQDDAIVPPAATELFVTKNQLPHYQVLDSDHSFIRNRPQVIAIVQKLFEAGTGV